MIFHLPPRLDTDTKELRREGVDKRGEAKEKRGEKIALAEINLRRQTPFVCSVLVVTSVGTTLVPGLVRMN